MGYVGLTKAAAEAQGLEVEEGGVAFGLSTDGERSAPDGMLKLVFRKGDGVRGRPLVGTPFVSWVQP